VKQGQQFGLAIDQLAAAIRDGSAIHALPDCATNIQSLDKLCCIAINAQLGERMCDVGRKKAIEHCNAAILLDF
jgi:hypothetical protein